MTYWSERAQKEREASNKKGEAEFKKELEALYNLQLSQLRKELDAYIQNFADKNGLTVSDAKRRADSFDIKAFEAKAKQYVADKDFSPKANKELRDYNFSMSVGRQELLIQELELELLVLSEGERQLTNNYLTNGYKSEIVRGSLLDQTVPNKKTLEKYMTTAVNANFEGAKWSERIWKRQEQLRNLVKTEVTRALIRGENGTTIAQRIRKYMDVSRTDAERLAITEHARVQTLAQQDIMKENGFEYFKLMPESRACDYCKQVGRDTEREPVPVDKMESGLNAPPMHPYCRCAVAEVYVEEVAKTSDRVYDENMGSMDLMAKSRQFVVGDDIRVRAKKVSGVDYDFWAQDSTKKIRDTMTNVAKALDELPNLPKPKMVFVKESRLAGFAGYDYRQDTLFISDSLHSADSVADILLDNYFAARDIKGVLVHELTHKRHWDSAREFYNHNKKRYNGVEQAKAELDSAIISFIKSQVAVDYNYLTRISEYADISGISRKYNEVIAEAMTSEGNVDPLLINKIKEVFKWK